jgi:LacI family transcriptional regulator
MSIVCKNCRSFHSSVSDVKGQFIHALDNLTKTQPNTHKTFCPHQTKRMYETRTNTKICIKTVVIAIVFFGQSQLKLDKIQQISTLVKFGILAKLVYFFGGFFCLSGLRENNMTTINEVADKAGVSIKTVSRVLNNYEHISTKTKVKVQAAMRDLNYTPSSIARQMRLGDSLSIGMLYGDPSSGYQASLNHSFLRACSDAGRYLAVELFDEKSRNWTKQVDAFLERTKITNMVLVPPLCDATDLHALLRERGVKFVLISPSTAVGSAISIQIDEKLAATEVVEHLAKLGHKRIAHISGNPSHVATLLRRKGYEEAMARAGLEFDPKSYVLDGGFNFKTALRSADKLLTMKDRPTAIFAANDEMASATLMVANRLGLRVPEDLSIVGFDDSSIAKVIWPHLTTVSQPFDHMATQSLEMLSKYPSEKNFDPIISILPHKLKKRESTAEAPE